MRQPTPTELAEIRRTAIRLKVPAKWLNELIRFETAGTYSPTIKNQTEGSSARGLIQFTDKTAQRMGYKSSYDLVQKNPTFIQQLRGPVTKYLKAFAPFPTSQSLYMSVFYPKARYWPRWKRFNERVRKWNPGINTVGDYVRKVEGTKRNLNLLFPAIILVGTYAIYQLSQGRSLWPNGGGGAHPTNRSTSNRNR